MAAVDGIFEGGRRRDVIVAHAAEIMGLGNDLPEHLRWEVGEAPGASQLSLGVRALLVSEVPEDVEDEIDEARLQSAAEAMSQGVVMGRAGEISKEIAEVVEEARRRRERQEMALDGYVDAADEADWP